MATETARRFHWQIAASRQLKTEGTVDQPDATSTITCDFAVSGQMDTSDNVTCILVPRVDGFSTCTGQGWYYEGDDIVVCPATCDVISNDEAGRVDIALGCATVII